MRLISQSDISKLYQEKIENIIKDFCDTYADKTMINNNTTSHTKGNINPIPINMNSIINHNSEYGNANANGNNNSIGSNNNNNNKNGSNSNSNRENNLTNNSEREIVNITTSLDLEGKIV